VSNNLIWGQSNYLKLIEKKKYAKAEKKINKGLSKTPDDIGLNYSMATLLIERKFKDYNSEKSYEFLIKSKSIYERLTDEKELKSLNKVPINKTTYDAYTDTICRCALEDATSKNDIETYQKFLDFYKTAPFQYKEKATENRNGIAFKTASDINTVDAYQNFISKYPDAIQINEARKKRDALAFENAKTIDNIESYKNFISKYPDAVELNQAWERVNELAYAEATKENTSYAYKKFIDEYPHSKQYTEAFRLFEIKQFFENTKIGDWISYRSFIEYYPENTWISAAQDSVYTIGMRTENLENLKYCVDNFTGISKDKALLLYHDVFTNDGEKQTLDLFYEKYDNIIFNDIKTKDYEIAELGKEVMLHQPYSAKYFSKYDEYIRIAAPREKAFVALQRMISLQIANKDWKSAIDKINTYLVFFGTRSKKLTDLISILVAKWDNSIKINSVGSGINTVNDEYVPVISADDKLLYFCGKNRKDNIGGEDIFVSKKINGYWWPAKIVSDLSSSYSNDAPLSVSSDGTMMLLFKSGKLYYSEKTMDGWTEAIEFPENINSGNWQSDAMISSDGKALLFASTKEGGYNISTDGSDEYPSDIYVSLLNENNEWGVPINLGNVINTAYCDRMPFLHPDMKTLYFSSDGHGGLGKLDVFKSTRLADSCWDCWSEPINMGKEINTEGSDWGYKISTDGEKAYFSKRSGVKENEDIYWLNLPPHLRPDLVATVSGKLIDKNKLPVSAEIRWEDLETGKKVGQSKSDPADGSFFIVLPMGKIYGYYVDKDEYFPISKNIDLRKNDKPVIIEENIDMVTFKQMIEDGTAVPVNNLFFNFAASSLLPYSLPELKRVATIIKSNNLKVEISGHTDNIGDDNKNQLLSEQRATAVKEFLVKEDCSADKLVVIGYGKTMPIASNDSEAGRAKNRRVELKFIK